MNLLGGAIRRALNRVLVRSASRDRKTKLGDFYPLLEYGPLPNCRLIMRVEQFDAGDRRNLDP